MLPAKASTTLVATEPLAILMGEAGPWIRRQSEASASMMGVSPQAEPQPDPHREPHRETQHQSHQERRCYSNHHNVHVVQTHVLPPRDVFNSHREQKRHQEVDYEEEVAVEEEEESDEDTLDDEDPYQERRMMKAAMRKAKTDPSSWVESEL